MYRYTIPRGSTLRAEYRDLISAVESGYEQSPRGVKTIELTNFVLELEAAESATFLNGIGRNASQSVLAAEMMQWAAGISDLKQLMAASPVFEKFSDRGDRLYGAYGPRAHAGLKRAVDLLATDESSRKASVSIWNNDEYVGSKDLPCTMSWSFMIRDKKLHMTTYMRSNDVWTGVTYDVPSMARIQSMLAWALRVELGSYTHIAQSMHIYDSDLEAIGNLHGIEPGTVDPPFFHGIGETVYTEAMTPQQRWSQVLKWCEQALAGESTVSQFKFYADRLAKLGQNPEFCEMCRYRLPQAELICPTQL